MFEQLSSIRKKIFSYHAYANTTMEDIAGFFDGTGAQTHYCRRLPSAYVENRGDGTFRLTDLPAEAQLTPLSGLLTTDVNHDGLLDVVGVGNFYGTDVVTGRYDAASGVTLLGNGRGGFRAMPNRASGFWVDGDARAIGNLTRPGKSPLLVVTQNADELKFFTLLHPAGSVKIAQLK